MRGPIVPLTRPAAIRGESVRRRDRRHDGGRQVDAKAQRHARDVQMVARRKACRARRSRAAPKDREGVESYRIVVTDPDGGNEDTLVDSPGQFMGFIHWLPSRQKGVGPKGQ